MKHGYDPTFIKTPEGDARQTQQADAAKQVDDEWYGRSIRTHFRNQRRKEAQQKEKGKS
jgi:hypothetical protein